MPLVLVRYVFKYNDVMRFSLVSEEMGNARTILCSHANASHGDPLKIIR